jgi:hypothetical protein
MSSFPQLSGHVDNRDQEIGTLRRQLSQLDEALRLERNKTGQIEAGARELRRILSPLYRALQAVFGELDAMGIQDGAVTTDSRWDSAKQRMPGKPAEFIDLLITHGAMNVTNFVTLAHCSKQTAYNVLSKLGQAGIVESNGGKYSLK